MFQKLLKKMYEIDASETNPISGFPCCKKENQLYILVPASNMDNEELTELEQLAEHLKEKGDRFVSTFLKTKDQNKLLELESGQYCVLTCQYSQTRTHKKIGRKLAKFHYRGRSLSFPVKKISRIGQWKILWEKRMDQMEKVWNSMLFQQPESEFDRMFLESFSYYMGIGENAIQYLVDTELDDDPKAIDNGTICHTRFTSQTWGDEFLIRNPFEWVVDHCSRDLAEWTRERYLHHFRTYQPDVTQFFTDYQSVEPLSSFSWRLLYARLLFPLHYVECIEDYYSSTSEEQKLLTSERLEKYLQQSSEHEKYLSQFFQLLEVPKQKLSIPVIDWL